MMLRIHLFHKWNHIDRETRICDECGKEQWFSCELGKWCDPDFLSGTNYDNCAHVSKDKQEVKR